MNEPEEVTLARSLIRQHDIERYQRQREEEARERLVWVAAHVGGRFVVDVDQDRWSVAFTARLLSADANGGTMTWDNGVTTEGVWVDDLDRAPDSDKQTA